MERKAFSTLDLGPRWLETLERLDYETMTAIQAASLPAMLAGEDVIGEAPTGTGKTVAFGLGLLSDLEPGGRLAQALVLCPTRELAAQVTDELRNLAWALPNTKILTICGGYDFYDQKRSLNHGVDVVVGTPGRVLDHLKKETLVLSGVTTLVFDEADRMLDMGFVDDVSKIASATPEYRQTLLFSATVTDEVRQLSERFQSDVHHIEVEAKAARPDIDQYVYELGSMDRFQACHRALATHRPASAVIFCNQRDTCDDLANRLRHQGYSVMSLHGGLDQRERDSRMLRFEHGSIRLLVATNVAARGLDVDALEGVINYELPRESKTFTHRVGRTARAGEGGWAVSLVDDRDKWRLKELEGHLGEVEPKDASVLTVPKGYVPPKAATKTVAIRGGRKDKLRAGDIVGALTGELGVANDAIGLITIDDRRAYVALDREVADEALRAIRKGQIKGRSFDAYMVG